jgi:hypothetical protein
MASLMQWNWLELNLNPLTGACIMKKLLGLLFVGFFLFPLLGAPSVFATQVQIGNASFESSPNVIVPEPNWGDYSLGIAGWSYNGKGICGVWSPNQNAYSMNVPDGNSIGFIDGGSGSIFKSLNHVLNPYTTLTLSLDIGNRFLWGTPNYEVQILAGDTVLAHSGSAMPADGLFSNLNLAYITKEDDPFGSDLGIKIILYSDFGQLNFDNLRFSNDTATSPVPEPATMLLLGVGLIGLAGFRRKKFQK